MHQQLAETAATVLDIPPRNPRHQFFSEARTTGEDNRQRGLLAGAALAAYATATGMQNEQPTDVLTDLLSDLLHLSDALGIDFDDAFSRAERNHNLELRGEL